MAQLEWQEPQYLAGVDYWAARSAMPGRVLWWKIELCKGYLTIAGSDKELIAASKPETLTAFEVEEAKALVQQLEDRITDKLELDRLAKGMAAIVSSTGMTAQQWTEIAVANLQLNPWPSPTILEKQPTTPTKPDANDTPQAIAWLVKRLREPKYDCADDFSRLYAEAKEAADLIEHQAQQIEDLREAVMDYRR